MPNLANTVSTVVIALEDETALTNLQACMETVAPPAPKYYIVHAIPSADPLCAHSSERSKAEEVLQKCRTWLKGRYPFARIESCLVEGRFDGEITSLVRGCDADVLIVSHAAANPADDVTADYAVGAPCSVLLFRNGRHTAV